ncbi:MAG: hypothetical protein U9R43_08820 [Thermodesulfobacteriota bacterium]|nr:hypothetical protein [Thermodesulfobacteriota bacterium]
MKTIVHLEMEIEVDFDAIPEEKMTRHCPGSPACIEVNDLIINNTLVSQELFNSIMALYEDEILEACFDEVKESEIERLVSDMEYRTLKNR